MLYFIVLSFLFVFFIRNDVHGDLLGIIVDHWVYLVYIVPFIVAFVLFKAVAIHISMRSSAIPFSFQQSVHLFMLTTFIDVTVFPNKVSSDVFKYAYLKDVTRWKRIKSILVFRLGNILFFVIIFILYFYRVSVLGTLGLLAVLLILSLTGVVPRIVNKVFSSPSLLTRADVAPLLSIAFLTFCDFCVEVGKLMVLLVFFFHISVPLDIIFVYIIAHSLGVLSHVPMGIGLKDISLSIYLIQFMSASDIFLFLVLMRLFGEILVAFLGWILIGRKIWKKSLRVPLRLHPRNEKRTVIPLLETK